jgi:UDP-glucose:glycoprotein glucosyltransferase
LDHLRRERKLVENFQKLGLTAPETVDLLSHRFIGEALAEDTPPRYNYRDEIEGGRVIIWMNNLEKDEKYHSFPSELAAV